MKRATSRDLFAARDLSWMLIEGQLRDPVNRIKLPPANHDSTQREVDRFAIREHAVGILCLPKQVGIDVDAGDGQRAPYIRITLIRI